MEIRQKRLLARIWCMVTVTILTLSLWWPRVTDIGQLVNGPIALLGTLMLPGVVYGIVKGWL